MRMNVKDELKNIFTKIDYQSLLWYADSIDTRKGKHDMF